MRAVMGGTFAYLHKGHRKLLSKAFSIGDYVYIGLTTDKYAIKNKKVLIEPYVKRRSTITEFVKKFGKKFDVKPLHDMYGPSTKGKFDIIVVTKETARIAKEINRIRKKKRLKKLRIIVVNYAMAYDRRRISSHRIYRKEIDSNGRKL